MTTMRREKRVKRRKVEEKILLNWTRTGGSMLTCNNECTETCDIRWLIVYYGTRDGSYTGQCAQHAAIDRPIYKVHS